MPEVQSGDQNSNTQLNAGSNLNVGGAVVGRDHVGGDKIEVHFHGDEAIRRAQLQTRARHLLEEMNDLADQLDEILRYDLQVARERLASMEQQQEVASRELAMYESQMQTLRDQLTVRPKSQSSAEMVKLKLVQNITLELVLIPAGEFLHGPSRKKNCIDHPYYIGKFRVTNRQYQAFCEAEGKKWPSDDKPVVLTSWNDAVAFCGWAAEQTDCALRLPGEVEWAKACESLITAEDGWMGGASPYKVRDLRSDILEWTATQSVKGKYTVASVGARNSYPTNAYGESLSFRVCTSDFSGSE